MRWRIDCEFHRSRSPANSRVQQGRRQLHAGWFVFQQRLWRERATNDADFAVVIEPTQVTEISRLLGEDFRVDSQMSFETVTMTTRYILHHPATAFKMSCFC